MDNQLLLETLAWRGRFYRRHDIGRKIGCGESDFIKDMMLKENQGAKRNL